MKKDGRSRPFWSNELKATDKSVGAPLGAGSVAFFELFA
jgi:hypothetical protein